MNKFFSYFLYFSYFLCWKLDISNYSIHCEKHFEKFYSAVLLDDGDIVLQQICAFNNKYLQFKKYNETRNFNFPWLSLFCIIFVLFSMKLKHTKKNWNYTIFPISNNDTHKNSQQCGFLQQHHFLFEKLNQMENYFHHYFNHHDNFISIHVSSLKC